jgi:hypothetical protein
MHSNISTTIRVCTCTIGPIEAGVQELYAPPTKINQSMPAFAFRRILRVGMNSFTLTIIVRIMEFFNEIAYLYFDLNKSRSKSVAQVMSD